MDATCAGIVSAFVDKVEAFARRWAHALLFIVGSGKELLVRANGRNDAAWLVRVLSTFEMGLCRWCGYGCRAKEFAGDARHIKLDVMVDGREAKA